MQNVNSYVKVFFFTYTKYVRSYMHTHVGTLMLLYMSTNLLSGNRKPSSSSASAASSAQKQLLWYFVSLQQRGKKAASQMNKKRCCFLSFARRTRQQQQQQQKCQEYRKGHRKGHVVKRCWFFCKTVKREVSLYCWHILA